MKEDYGTEAVCVASKESEARVQLDMLQKVIEEHRLLVEELENRLLLVLVPSTPEKMNVSDGKECYTSPLCENLARKSVDVERVSGTIRGIMSRLTV